MEIVSTKYPSKPDKTIIHQNDVALLDFLKGHFEFSTDVKLATYMGLTRHAVYKVRAGDVALGNGVRLRLLENAGQFRQFIPLPELSTKRVLSQIFTRAEPGLIGGQN